GARRVGRGEGLGVGRGQGPGWPAARVPRKGGGGEAHTGVGLVKENAKVCGSRPRHRRNRRGGRQREAATLYPGFRRVAIVFRRISCVQGEPLLYALSSPRQTGWLVGPCSRRPVRPG